MSDSETTESDSRKSQSKGSSDARSTINRVLLVPYPKFIFMYPTLIVSFIAALVLSLSGDGDVNPAERTLPVTMTGLFLVVMMFNMFVIVFDFPRATSLTLLFIVSTLALGFWMLVISKPDVLPSIQHIFQRIRPAANSSFFWCITGSMALMYLAVMISVRFNYWELRNNELLHHHGMLSDLKRYPAPNLRVDKEIVDVFEYMLCGAGRLTLHPTGEKRSIVLDNVLWVTKKERELTRMLGSIKVQINTDSTG